MIGVGFLRCFFLGGIMIWYSASVWQTVDQYFRDQFKVYLEKEYENNEEIKKDVMLEAQRVAAKKALVEKIAKMQFAKALDKHVKGDGVADGDKGTDISNDVDEVVAEYIESGYANGVSNAEVDRGGTGGTDGTRGTVWTNGTVGTDGTGPDLGGQKSEGEEASKEVAQTDELSWQRHEIPEEEEYDITEEECESDVSEENVEPEEGIRKWTGIFDEDDEVCRYEDLGKKDSCADP